MPSVSAGLLSEARTIAAYLVFLGSYIVFAVGKFPGMKIDLRGPVDRVAVSAALLAPEFQHTTLRKKPVIVLAIVLAGFLAGVPPALMASIGAAVLLMTRTVEPRHVYDEVDWGLLVFFVGLYVGFREYARVGLPLTLATLVVGCLWLWATG